MGNQDNLTLNYIYFMIKPISFLYLLRGSQNDIHKAIVTLNPIANELSQPANILSKS
jgi:hypothetical protein